MSYIKLHADSVKNPKDFWANEANQLVWFKKWDSVLNHTAAPISNWFSGGLFNICYNCLDRHIENGKGSKIALIYDSPLTGQKPTTFTYFQLKDEVEKMAFTLAQLGAKTGDCVVILMPKTVEGVATMLACARIGAIQCTLYTALPAQQIAHRLALLEPKVVVVATGCFINCEPFDLKKVMDKAISLSIYKPQKCIVVERPGIGSLDLVPGRDMLWNELKLKAGKIDCVHLEATAPIYILQTSGTTGAPKAVVTPSAGFAVGLLSQMRILYPNGEDEVFFTTSELGWQVSQDYVVYGALLSGSTSVVYEGEPVGTPDPSAFYRLIDEHEITRVVTNLSAFRAIRKQDPNGLFKGKYNLESLRDIMVTGESTDLVTMMWASERFGVPIIDGWGQTETGRFITGAYPDGQFDRSKPIAFAQSIPFPGWDVRVLRPHDRSEANVGETGRVVIKLPMPPSALTTLLNQDRLCIETYFEPFPGYYDTKDEGVIDADGTVKILGRTDDLIKVGPLPVVCSALEEVLLQHPYLAECVVVALPDVSKNNIPLGIYCVKNEVENSEVNITKDLLKLVNENVGSNTCLLTVKVKSLPKTLSGKTARSVIKAIINGNQNLEYDNFGIIKELEEILIGKGYVKQLRLKTI